MTITALKQLSNGIIIHIKLLKTNQRVNIINKNTPTPNTTISFLINDIMSSAIIGTPPK